MAANEPDDTSTRPDANATPAAAADRYAALELDNGSVVIYDPDNHHAWLQSDGATVLSAMA